MRRERQQTGLCRNSPSGREVPSEGIAPVAQRAAQHLDDPRLTLSQASIYEIPYPDDSFDFGRSYIIPKPFDPRVLIYVAPAVAKAAMDSGVAREKIDLVAYGRHLEQIVGALANL